MRHSVRARLSLTSVCTVCALALPASALASGAAGSPVHVDPASPVAKEYALPLATARGAPPESGQSGKLFGSGIKHASRPAVTRTTAAATPEAPPAVPQSNPPPAAPVPTSAQATPAPTVTAPAPSPPTTTKTARRPTRRPVHVTTVTLPVLTTPVVTRQLGAKATPAAYRVLKPGTGSGLLWMVLAAVVVLALGSAGGLALSRRR